MKDIALYSEKCLKWSLLVVYVKMILNNIRCHRNVWSKELLVTSYVAASLCYDLISVHRTCSYF